MDVEEALGHVGGMRRWNILAFVMLSLSAFFCLCWQGVSIIFIGWEPPHECAAEDGGPLNQTLPPGKDGKPDSCRMYANLTAGNETKSCDQGWYYDSQGYETIVTEFSLVCEANYLAELSQLLYQITCLFGEFIASYLIDKFGRKKVHIVACLLVAVCGTCVGFSPNYLTFVILRCLTALLVVAALTSGITLLMEIFDSGKRTEAGIGLEFIWIFVYVMLDLLAWICLDWRMLQIIISVVNIVWIIYIWIIPESAAWLVAYEKYDEAQDALHKMARWNGVAEKIPEVKLYNPREAFRQKAQQQRKSIMIGSMEIGMDDLKGVEVPVSDLWKDSTLRKHLLLSCVLWFGNSVVYYGLILLNSSFGGNRFLSFLYMGVAELVAYTVAFLVLTKLPVGRRKLLIFFHLVAGLALFVAAFVPRSTDTLVYVVMAAAIIGKFGISGSFSIIVLYTKELFPASLRGTSAGAYLAAGRVGNITSPVSAYVGKQLFWLPNLVFGIISILTGFSTLWLPETRGKALPLTTSDVRRVLYAKETSKKEKTEGTKQQMAELLNSGDRKPDA